MKNYSSNVLKGLIFIIIGLGFAGNALGIWHFTPFFPGWWTLFIIIPCALTISKKGANPLPTAGLIIGILFFLSEWRIFPMGLIWRMFIPITLIIIGFNLIFKGSFHFRGKQSNQSNVHYHSGAPEYSAIFNSQKIACEHETFYGASINAIFGGIEMDLSDAYFQEDVVLNCTSIFGGADIHVPSNINVQVSCVPIFGGVTNRAKTGLSDAPTLYINATCMFGGIDIK